MEINIFKTYDEMSYHIAESLVQLLEEKKDSIICIAGGDTPKRVCEYLVQFYQEKKVDFSECSFLSLDEWVGLDIHTEGSCIATLSNNLFKPLNLNSKQIIFFDGKAEDLSKECQRIKTFVKHKGGLDWILLGVGMNGHLGFNEPNCDTTKHTMVVELDEVTKTVGQKYFKGDLELEQGITLGIALISESKNIILMANGAHKSEIINKTVNAPISSTIPSTLLRENPNVSLYIDKDAALEILEK